jgi:hypothetical protein
MNVIIVILLLNLLYLSESPTFLRGGWVCFLSLFFFFFFFFPPAEPVERERVRVRECDRASLLLLSFVILFSYSLILVYLSERRGLR